MDKKKCRFPGASTDPDPDQALQAPPGKTMFFERNQVSNFMTIISRYVDLSLGPGNL